MDLLLLVLSILGLAGSVALIVLGVYFILHPEKRPHVALKIPELLNGNGEKPEDFLNVLEKAQTGLEKETKLE